MSLHLSFTGTARGPQHPIVASLPSRRLVPEEAAALVRAVRSGPQLWREAVRHDPVTRWHRRVLWTPDVEVYLLGWAAEQDTRLHDHGGSIGAFAVVDGSLFEECGRAGQRSIGHRTHRTGTVVSFDATHVHNLGNHGPAPATSIHAYSPPLPFMRFYEPDAAGRLQANYQLAVDGPEPDDSSPPMPVEEHGSLTGSPA